MYPRLAAACQFDCLIDAPDISTPNTATQLGPRRLNARWVHYASVKADLDMAIGKLPIHLRTVVLLYYCAGQLDVRTVAKDIGISTGTVFNRLKTAKRCLAERLCDENS